jgi:hypothetical protein
MRDLRALRQGWNAIEAEETRLLRVVIQKIVLLSRDEKRDSFRTEV